MRHRVRGGRGRAQPRPGPAAGARRPGGARPPRGVRGRRRVERRRGRRAAAGAGAPRALAGPTRQRAAGDRHGCSCRAAGSERARARTLVERGAARRRACHRRWRRVPVEVAALGAAAAATRPTSPRRSSRARSTRDGPTGPGPRVRAAPRRRPAAARVGRRGPSGLDDLSVPSVSCRTIVYKGLVAGGRLAAFYPDLARPIALELRALPPALRDEHAADLAARPAVPLDRPQRRDRHRPGQPRAGPRPSGRRGRGPHGDRGAGARRGRAAPVAGRLRLPVARRDARAARRDRLGPGLGAARGDARGVGAAPARRTRTSPTLRRRTAGLLAPVGRPGRDRLLRRPAGRRDPRSQRAAAGGVRGDAGPAGRRGIRGRRDPARRVARPSGAGGSGPGEMLLVDPRRRAILEDADAKAHLLRRLPIHDAPRPAHVDRSPPADRAATPSSLRYLAGLDAEKRPPRRQDDGPRGPRAALVDGRRHADARPRPGRPPRRRPSPPVVRPGHEPADRPGAGAGGDGPAGRPRPAAGAPRRAAARRSSRATVRLDRPVVADLDGLARDVPGPARPAARRDLGSRGGARRPRRALDAARAGGRRCGRARGAELHRRLRPRVLARAAAGPVGPRGRRGQHRADRCRAARPGRHPRRRGRRPRRPRAGDGPRRRRDGGRPVARGRAGDRDGRARAAPRSSRRDAAVDNLLAAFEAGLRKTLARMGISTVASYVGGLLFESLELDDDLSRPLLPAARRRGPGRSASRDIAGRRIRRARCGPADRRRPAVEPAARIPGFARFRADGEAHLFSPKNAAEIPALRPRTAAPRSTPRSTRYRGCARPAAGAVVRDGLRVRRGPPSVAVDSPTSSRPATSSDGSWCRRCASARSRPRPTRR